MFEFEYIAQLLIDEAEGMDCALWPQHRNMLESRIRLMEEYAGNGDSQAARAVRMLTEYVAWTDDWFTR